MSSKETYKKALEIIKEVNNVDNILQDAGITLGFDNENKPVDRLMNVLFLNPKDIACEALGLVLRTKPEKCKSNIFPIDIDVYYPENGDVKFSILFENMWDLLDKLAEDEEAAEKTWDCFVNGSKESRAWLAKKFCIVDWK